MKHIIYLVIGMLFFAVNLPAQQLKGYVINKKGEPLPNATVYIYELAKGIVTDDFGEFQTNLDKGTYTCEFRSLGYESLKKSIVMSDENQTVQIELKESSYMLREVVIYPGKEDPAYRIMRKAIAYAPYYRYQIKEYQSEAYIKGGLTINKIPKIIKKAIAKETKKDQIDFNTLIGKPLIMESQSKIHYTSPEKYEQKVIALKSSIPNEFKVSEGLSITTSSIYESKFNGRISPLANGAFRYYAYKLEDVDYQTDYVINKIKVIPRKNNPNLYSGYIYVLENTWNIYAADLHLSQMGSKMRYQINYHAVKPSVFLPTTYDISMQMNIMGMSASVNYFASMKYNKVSIDKKPMPIVADTEIVGENVIYPEEKISPKQQNIWSEIEKLSNKEELSTKESYRMAKLIGRTVEPQEIKESRESLEIKTTEKVKMEVDTLAWEKDNNYWEKIRELPLREDEINSYILKDSLFSKDSVDAKKSQQRTIYYLEKSNPENVFGKIIQGGMWQMNKKVSIGINGLVGAVKEYNFVDGFWLGQTFDLNYAYKKNRNFSLTPSFYYATARNKLLWQVETSLNYAPMMLGEFSLSVGHKSRDINAENGESRFMNAYTSLAYGNNFIHFYDSRFIKAENKIYIANGLQLYTAIEYDKRSSLQIATTYNLFGKDIQNNTPFDGLNYPNQSVSIVTLGLEYTPFYRYRLQDGAKTYVTSKYPTFSVLFKKGIGHKTAIAPSFSRLSFGIDQNVSLSPFESIDYSLSGGVFLSNKNLFIHDFKYFANNRMLFTANTFNRSFSTLPAYYFSQKWWIENHFNYQSQYLLLKNLPFLQHFLFDEGIHLHSLITENQNFYLEGGYSIGFSNLIRVGVFAGFADFRYHNFGIKISYPLWKILENPLK